MSEIVRDPVVSGMFYPADRDELRRMVEGFLAAVPARDGPSPKAIVAPHAGYVYSGSIAAHAYACVQPDSIRRVVLLGPAHRVWLEGVGASSASAWRTPLGDVPVEAPPGLPILDAAHAEEHSLEVQLPFLQVVLNDFTLIPLVVGHASKEEISDILDSLWGGDETLIVISSDLSHYEDYETANRMDSAASQAIVNLDPNGLDAENACGRVPICGLLHLAKQKGMRAKLIDLRNSGDTAGSRDQVVGYGAYAFYE
ncbi:MAG: AmmeMemoRadiSam system protein B [Verrucomicrobia bacterium]|nr:MAG: AmmeMemoRadiSam system protein B [Verrucomicrobiota bacterium]